MLVRFTKHPPAAEADLLTCVRADGSTTRCAMPRQGVLPRLALHFVIEASLGWHHALFGHIAAGAALDEFTAARSTNERGRNVPLRQAAALAECLEADLWGGAVAPADFAPRLQRASRRRGVSPADLTPTTLEQIRTALRGFGAAWRPLAPGQSLERSFRTTNARVTTRRPRRSQAPVSARA